MSVNQRGRVSRQAGGGNAALNVIRSFAIMLILAALSFGLGFGVLAKLLPGSHKPDEAVNTPAVTPTASKPAASTPAASPAQTPDRTATNPAAPATTSSSSPGPTLSPDTETETSGKSDVQKPRAVEGEPEKKPSTTEADPGAGDTTNAAVPTTTRKKRHARSDTETQANPTTATEEPNSASTERPAAPVRTRETGETVPESRSNGLYRVQVGVFSTREAADRVAQSAREKGFTIRVQPFQQNGVTLYRVQHGAFRDRAHADAARESLNSAGFETNISSPTVPKKSGDPE